MSAFAQSVPIVQSTPIIVTGSNIPRIDGETSLPVQVITREEIERANIQTAAELVGTISANMSFQAANEAQALVGSGAPGFAGASLRGLSYNRTLLLLNGRRVVNYAFSSNGIDLNSIPLAAIERVEVLKDGASAIYGSDAIAGVINFILRKNYQGADAYAQYSSPEHTGGYSKQFTVTAGYGDLAGQRFNAFALVDYQKYGGIKARDRPFSATYYIPGEGVDQTSSNSFPANVDTPQGPRNPTGDPNDAYRNPSCAPPLSFPTVGSPRQCRFDNAVVIDSFVPSERTSVLGAFTWQIDPDNQFFLNGNYTRNEFTYTASPQSISGNFRLPPTSVFYPHAFANFFGIDGTRLSLRWRPIELGLRTDAPISEQWNVVAGIRGFLRGWTYDGAFTYSESNVNDRFVDGYLKQSVLIPILNSGIVNPFGFNTPEVVQLMSTAKIDGTVSTGKGTLRSVDFHASKEIYPMPAGPLMLALGAEARRWELAQTSKAELASGDIIGFGTGVPSVTATRNVWAVFAEANVPLLTTLEADVAVRYDHYSDFGSTTNPKLSFRWQPGKTFLIRGSVGTGFKAPGLVAIYGPPQLTTTSSQSDPIRCPVTNSTEDCNAQFPQNSGGNPLLEAEKSTQWGIGAVWVAAPGVTVGLDYFDILLKNAITGASDALVFRQCPDGLTGPTCRFVHRGPVDPNFPNLPGPITLVDSFLTNIGKVRVSGIDINAQIVFPKVDLGQFRLSFQGSYTIKYLQQRGNEGYQDFVNRELSPGVVPRWHHYLTLDWNYGPWSATLTDNYQTGTQDENPGPNTGSARRKIGDYDIWNIAGAYTGFKDWTVSAGIKNLLDRDPPFSNQSATSGAAAVAGYDPTYTDPHGRLFWASVKYSFK